MNKEPHIYLGKPNKEQDLAWNNNILSRNQNDLSNDQTTGKYYRMLICEL